MLKGEASKRKACSSTMYDVGAVFACLCMGSSLRCKQTIAAMFSCVRSHMLLTLSEVNLLLYRII